MSTQEFLSFSDILSIDEQGRYSMEDLFNFITSY